MKSLDEILATCPVTRRLSPEQAAKLARLAREVAFEEGSAIFTTGGPAEEFYLLRAGAVALEARAPNKLELTIQTLRPGEALGWSWLFPPYRWHFDARALDRVDAFAFDAAKARALCEEDHELGYRLLFGVSQGLVDRLQATRLQLLDLYGQDE